MSPLDSGLDVAKNYWVQGVVIGAGSALVRWLRRRGTPSSPSPHRLRNLLLYLTAIREYETATATALFWKEQTKAEQAKTEQERQAGLRWKALYEACQSGLKGDQTPILPIDPGHDSPDGSG